MGSLRGSERAGAGSRAGSRAGSAPRFNTAGSCAERLILAGVRSGPTSLSAFPRTLSSLRVGTCGSAGARGMEAGGRGGRGAGAVWPSGPGEAGLGLAFWICTSWRVRARLCLPRRRHLRAMPNPPELGRTTRGGGPQSGQSAVAAGPRLRRRGVWAPSGMGPRGLALRPLPARGGQVRLGARRRW